MMSDHSPIEWTEATWNPIAGCSVVSPGCTNCYAMRRSAPRLAANPATPHYAGTVETSRAGPVWTGRIGIAADAVFLKPLRWRRPRMIFVNSTSDLFHPGVPDAVIDRVFAVMALCPQHTFQVLTKRPSRMREYLASPRRRRIVSDPGDPWPLPNVWLGTSVEDQRRADERLPHLLATPAAVRFVSAEPLLGPVDLDCPSVDWMQQPEGHGIVGSRLKYDWVIVGGESGAGARPMHPDWARSLRDQCAAAAVPFLFKQWGQWLDVTDVEPKPVSVEDRIFTPAGKVIGVVIDHGSKGMVDPDWREQGGAWMLRVNKHVAGRLLDGVEHNAIPSRSSPVHGGGGPAQHVEGAPPARRPSAKRTYAEHEDEIDV